MGFYRAGVKINMNKKPLNLETLGEIRKPKRKDESNATNMILHTRRRTARNIQLNLKVTPEFYNKLLTISQKNQCYMVEILEKALDSYIDR